MAILGYILLGVVVLAGLVGIAFLALLAKGMSQ